MWFTAPVRTAEPQQPAVSPSPRFPWIPAVTPVVLAVLMSLLFQSSLALIMGVVGPAMVAGAWWESQRSHHRSDRASWQEYEEQLSLAPQPRAEPRKHETRSACRATGVAETPQRSALARRTRRHNYSPDWYRVVDAATGGLSGGLRGGIRDASSR